MKYLKHIALVTLFICYSCARKAENSTKVSTSDILIEETPIDFLESYDDVLVDKTNTNIAINHSLIEQKLNEIVELQLLHTQNTEFNTEIEQQLQKLTKGKIFFDSAYLHEKITAIKYLSAPLQLNDSTKTINLSFNLGSHEHRISVMIISSKRFIDGNTYTNQEISFMAME